MTREGRGRSSWLCPLFYRPQEAPDTDSLSGAPTLNLPYPEVWLLLPRHWGLAWTGLPGKPDPVSPSGPPHQARSSYRHSQALLQL